MLAKRSDSVKWMSPEQVQACEGASLPFGPPWKQAVDDRQSDRKAVAEVTRDWRWCARGKGALDRTKRTLI